MQINEQSVLDRFLRTFSEKRLGEEVFKFNGKECVVGYNYIFHAAFAFKTKLQGFLPKNAKAFVAGGAVANFFMSGDFNNVVDFDIWPLDSYENKKILNHLKGLKDVTILQTPHATRHIFLKNQNVTIDVITPGKIKYEPSLTELLRAFDLNVAKFGFSIHENYRFEKQCSWEDLFNMKMSITPGYDIKNAGVGQLKRLLKYSRKGFKIDNKNLLKYFCQITTRSKEEYDKEYPIQQAKLPDYSTYETLQPADEYAGDFIIQ